MTAQQLAEIKACAAAATPGPWFTVDTPWRASEGGTYVVAGSPDPHLGTPVLDSVEIMEWPAEDEGPDYSQSDADLTFAARARSWVPTLVAEIERLQAELKERTS